MTEKHRLRLARLIVDDGLPITHAAQRFQVAWPTAKRWAERYRNLGPAGMGDRSSRPHHSPTRTRPAQVRAIVRD
ncbi:helix-turn-helix domain-containing protein [Pseudonocardia sp. ICBG1142]|uniref:helix-turn-helix domain-containing protein n=1 Tax=Pseudonocardia sp. ICBG1142 TaxID=2846760 RepID=UPI002104AA8D|nr:leucine zipper domain-containing protein [Pseudonocardia sp. ICBG1142]